jgi:hypothetical protein
MFHLLFGILGFLIRLALINGAGFYHVQTENTA